MPTKWGNTESTVNEDSVILRLCAAGKNVDRLVCQTVVSGVLRIEQVVYVGYRLSSAKWMTAQTGARPPVTDRQSSSSFVLFKAL
jgi:hypothetical protein